MGRANGFLGLCIVRAVIGGASLCGAGLSAGEEAGPRRSPVIVNEIHYHPGGDAGLREEFVELYNRTDASVDLHGWAFSGGINFQFDRSAGPASIAARGFLLVARNPAAVGRVARIPPTAIAGPYTGKLSNSTDRIVLSGPNGNVVEVVEYAQGGSWPARADGLGSSLQRISSDAPGNLPQNWDVVFTDPPVRVLPAPAPPAQVPRGYRREESPAGVLRRLLERLRGGPAPAVPAAIPRDVPAGVPRDDGTITPGKPNAVALKSMPPLVTFLERTPEQPRPDDRVTIRVRVEGTRVESVDLYYDLGAGERSIRLAADGRAPGGADAGTNVYSGAIPPAPDQTVVRFRIAAKSRDGAAFRLPRNGNPSPHLGYYVLDRPRDGNDDLDVYHILWNGRLSCSKGRWLRGCTFVHRGTADLDVRLKYRGYTSCGKPKSGLKVAFNRGDLFHGQARLNLLGCWQDRSFLREKLAWDLFRDTGHPHCEAKMAAVYSYGNQLHGLFVALEEPGKRYLRRNNLDSRAILWKCHTSFLRSENSKSRTYEKRTNEEDGQDTSALLEFEGQLNSLTGAALREYVLRHIDIESLIEYQSLKALISDEDGYSKNWYLCQETEEDESGQPFHRWSVHPWDMDLSFGQYSLNTDEIRVDRHPLAGTVDHPRHGSHGIRWNGLVEAVFGRESGDYFIKALYGRLWGMLEEKFDPSVLGEQIDRIDLSTLEEARQDLARMPRWGVEGQNVEFHRERLREYVAARHAFLQSFLASEQPTTASEVGPWEPSSMPRVASGIVPPRAVAHRTFRHVPAPRMRIVEIHYHPADDEKLEFVEIRNLESVDVDVSGWDIPAVGFTFPKGSKVPAGDRFVVARDPAKLLARYERTSRRPVFGPYPGRLSNQGEDLRLRDSGRYKGKQYFPETIDVVKYRDRSPWPSEADGKGRSLELTDLAADNDLPGSWEASGKDGGSPGE